MICALLQSDDEDDDGGFQLDELLKSDSSDSRSEPDLVEDLLEEDSVCLYVRFDLVTDEVDIGVFALLGALRCYASTWILKCQPENFLLL